MGKFSHGFHFVVELSVYADERAKVIGKGLIIINVLDIGNNTNIFSMEVGI